jgi:hypothetical protein
MKHIRLTVSATALLAMAACSAAKPVEPAASAPPPAPATAAAVPVADPLPGIGFTGVWYVSGVYPVAAAQASAGDPHLGAALAIGSNEVSDVNGQRCVTPAFEADQVDASATGLKGAPTRKWDRLTVNCAGKAFATYLRVPQQAGEPATLLQQRPEGLYLLEQADTLLHRLPRETSAAAQPSAPRHETAPVIQEAAKTEKKTAKAPAELVPPAAAPAPVPAAVPEGPVAADTQVEPAAKPAATPAVAAKGDLPASGTAVHLASYKGESAAKRGWKILLGDYDELDPLSPLYVAVDVPGKGPIIRLYATGGNKAGLAKICAALKAKKVYCALNP